MLSERELAVEGPNAVGSTTPSSPPRGPSRHRRASRAGQLPDGARDQPRRSTGRDLRGAGGGGAPVGETENGPRGVRPAA
jgi:hypothetical protein